MTSPTELEARFTQLLTIHGAALGRLAASYARGAEERKDLFQDIALAIWLALPQFRGDCSERTFLFRVAHNRGITHISKRRLPIVEAAEQTDVADARPSPEQALSTQQQANRLAAAVDRLPMEYRQVMTLALEGLPYREIADVVGISEGNVGVRLTRARQMLRQWLEDSHGRS